MSAPQASLTQAAAQLMDQGVEWMQQGQPGRAADCWRRVVEMTPDFAPALNSLGAYYLSQERFDESQALLERAVAAAPDLAIAHANLSRIHSLRGEAELALKAIDLSLIHI